MGQLQIREEAGTPATPSQGVILFSTVATPSILKLLDDAGALTTFALLERAQTFSAQQTFTAGIVSNPASAGVAGINITPPTGINVASVLVNNADVGAGGSIFMQIGRNSNATNASGFLRIFGKTGNANDIWADASAAPGILRIGNATGTATDTGGSVVGAQTSSLDQKDVIEQLISGEEALQVIASTPLFRFRYKDGRLGGGEYLGIITDYSPVFGADPDEGHPNGRILNEVNAHGYAMAAIQALLQRVEELETRVKALEHG